MTRNERKLIALAQTRAHIQKRKAEATKHHKSTEALHAKHVEATRQLIKAELRAEKNRAA